jgi:hypothetical protein
MSKLNAALLPALMMALTPIKGIAAHDEEFNPADHGLTLKDVAELVDSQAAVITQEASQPADTAGTGDVPGNTAAQGTEVAAAPAAAAAAAPASPPVPPPAAAPAAKTSKKRS